jgi:flagellar hook-associated protein 1 FlgK
MSGSFSGLTTALSGLQAQRTAMDATGQNLANMATPGYSRQRAELTSVGPPSVTATWSSWSTAGNLNTGLGVAVTDITRFRDQFADQRMRTEHGVNSSLAQQAGTASRVEELLPEPSDTGLQSQLTAMWGAWSDVANNPGDLSARTALLHRASSVADTLRAASTGIASAWSDNRGKLDTVLTQVNNAADAVAKLNQSIATATDTGTPVNELKDQRDQLTLTLSELTGATATEQPDHTVTVSLGGAAMVSGITARHLAAGGATDLTGQSTSPVALTWTDDGSTASSGGGTVGGILTDLGSTLPGWSSQLDTVAATLINTVNQAHTSAYDLTGTPGGTFFAGSTAADIQVAITDPSTVAASANPAQQLDGSAAAGLAALASSATGADAGYHQLITALGTAVASANQRATAQAAVAQAADSDVDSASGVSLDEEMTNLLTEQRAYQAAAKVMSTADAMLDTLINHTV